MPFICQKVRLSWHFHDIFIHGVCNLWCYLPLPMLLEVWHPTRLTTTKKWKKRISRKKYKNSIQQIEFCIKIWFCKSNFVFTFFRDMFFFFFFFSIIRCHRRYTPLGFSETFGASIGVGTRGSRGAPPPPIFEAGGAGIWFCPPPNIWHYSGKITPKNHGYAKDLLKIGYLPGASPPGPP